MNKGLYQRDYFELSEKEIDEMKKFDSPQYINGRMNFKKSDYLNYPKAYRHNKSLFPNNLVDVVDLRNKDELNRQCEEFLTELNKPEMTELGLKSFIQDKYYYHIPASLFSQYRFGHHEAFVFKEFQLGTTYIADYVLVGEASGGYQFIFIEFESPYGSISIDDGDFGETIRKGINQINDWKDYIPSNYNSIKTEFMKYTDKDLPKEFHVYDQTRCNYLVVGGRRDEFKEKTYRLARNSLDQIKIFHYDNLYDFAKETIGRSTY